MSIVGVPMFLAPIFGPVIGGALVGAASWRWIFFVNLRVGALALALALWLLPSTLPRSRERLDTLGLGLLSGGIVLFVYGLAAIGSSDTESDPTALGAMVAGLAPVAGFGWHALRISHPLIDIRLFTDRGFATAAAATLVLGVPLFGAMLLPLYFQIVRGQSPLQTGILLIPQGLGAAVANKALRLAAHLAIYRNHIDGLPQPPALRPARVLHAQQMRLHPTAGEPPIPEPPELGTGM
jgi:MFS family permease